MATIVLGTLGGLAGGAIGGPIGATIGRALGALGGSLIDQAVADALSPRPERPRLTTTDIQSSTEGSVIDRVYGRARVPGQIIWATRFLEEEAETAGGKGTLGQPAEGPGYVYSANFAVALCEGPIAGFGRIWADGVELDQTLFEIRFHSGADDQAPDPLIAAKEEHAPAYRGVAYLVFEHLPLAQWGNRLPQVSVEVFNPTGALESEIRSVAIIAGNEFGFDPALRVDQVDGPTENRRGLTAVTDFVASIDRLQQLCPNLEAVMLVLPWFGDDLRCGTCTIRPKVEDIGKVTTPLSWSVGGLARAEALAMSQVDGRPAYGGASTDESAIRAIEFLKSRGLHVTVYPFIMMDIAAGNSLANPYSDDAAGEGQWTYPWRGRITCSPAPGFEGSPDKSGDAGTQVAAFVGTAAPTDFGGTGTAIDYSGPDEWSFRRFILHHAVIADRGGADCFLIGSEMIGMTSVRSATATYPFVDALIELAADCRTILGSEVELSYAADWSEYHSHRPGDGSNDVCFNLDPLWADANIDFIGIDNYLPLSDWRDGADHLDFDPTGPTSIHDQTYLRSHVEGGEHFDWYYASPADRDAQIRSPITDGAYGKPWVYRNKDIRSWWSNAHHDRPGGVEAGSPTALTPKAKPIRFTELGCPAVDKGSNQPNVFPDPKSVEGTFPHYSSHARDDVITRSYLAAMMGHWADNNPLDDDDRPMLELDRTAIWCWDARPWPSFPLDASLWGDAPNWQTGHWVSGRLGAAPARETITAILEDADFDTHLVEPIPLAVDGVTSGQLLSARDVLEALQPAYQFDAVESGAVIRFVPRHGRPPLATITSDELVVAEPGGAPWRQTRAQETDLPSAIKLRYADNARNDQPAGTEARRSAGGSRRTHELAPPVVSYEQQMTATADRELRAAWAARERASFVLPPSRLALDVGDVVSFAPTGSAMRLASIGTAGALAIEAHGFDGDAGGVAPAAASPLPAPVLPIHSPTTLVLIDGPLLRDGDLDHAGYVAATALPFGDGVALYRGPSDAAFALDRLLGLAGTIGLTTGDFHAGPVWRWDEVNALYVHLRRGTFITRSAIEVLNGANGLLVENEDGEWELLQFRTATPLGGDNWRLAGLLRGQRGTEHAMRAPVSTGARIVAATPALVQTGLPAALVGVEQIWRATPAGAGTGSSRAIDETRTMLAKARRPLAPVHLGGQRDPGTGDWTLRWVRRTRIGGDGLDQVEVPLGEDSEAYRLEILDGPSGAVLRSFETTATVQLYSVAEQTADFGSAQYSFTARVAQMSASFGPGTAAEALIWVR